MTCRVFVFGALLLLLAAQLITAQEKAEWTWRDKSGATHTRTELDTILTEHHEWEASNHKSGKQASLGGANLRDAYLLGAKLNYADLSYVDLSGANVWFADLNFVTLTGAHLNHAGLEQTRLSYAYLVDADLRDITMVEGSFYHAQMARTRLSGSNLRGVNFGLANLDSTDLANADLWGAELDGAIFEPKSLPELRGIAAAKNLESLTYWANPDALVQLRKQFEDAGFRQQERKITYALMRRQAELSWKACTSRKLSNEDKTRAIVWSPDSNLANCGSWILNRVFFDWTCQYGMSPGRPLSLGVLLWFACSLLYFVCNHVSGDAGLYRIYDHDVREGTSGQRRVERISAPNLVRTQGVRWLFQFFRREWVLMRASMFFSLISAFNIGFRDINFGRWLRLLTRKEFDMKAVGWARVVAGWESLISVFLLALWVLSYFGRPFG